MLEEYISYMKGEGLLLYLSISSKRSMIFLVKSLPVLYLNRITNNLIPLVLRKSACSFAALVSLVSTVQPFVAAFSSQTKSTTLWSCGKTSLMPNTFNPLCRNALDSFFPCMLASNNNGTLVRFSKYKDKSLMSGRAPTQDAGGQPRPLSYRPGCRNHLPAPPSGRRRPAGATPIPPGRRRRKRSDGRTRSRGL